MSRSARIWVCVIFIMFIPIGCSAPRERSVERNETREPDPVATAVEVKAPRGVELGVTVRAPGVPPESVDALVVAPLEGAVRAVAGVTGTASVAERGRAVLHVDFAPDLGRDEALARLAEMLRTVGLELPRDAGTPELTVVPGEDDLVATFVIVAAEGTEADAQVVGELADDLRSRLVRVPYVSEVEIRGGVEKEIAVTVDPERLSRFGLTPGTVLDALRGENESSRPFVSTSELEDTAIASGPGAVEIRLRDVATIRERLVPPRGELATDARGAVALDVYRSRDGRANDVRREVVAESESARAGWPPDVGLRILAPGGDAVASSVLLLRLEGPNLADLCSTGETIASSIGALPNVEAVLSDTPRHPVVRVDFDPSRLAAFGFAESQVARELRYASGVTPLGKIDDGKSELPVVFVVDVNPEALGDRLLLLSREQRLVPLREIAEIRQTFAPESIRRRNGRLRVTLRIELLSGADPGETLRRARELLDAVPLPAGVEKTALHFGDGSVK